MGLDEVVHHIDELLIAGVPVVHDRPKHVQNISALRIHEPAVCAWRLERIQPETHPDRPGIIRAIAPLVFLDDVLTLAIPVL